MFPSAGALTLPPSAASPGGEGGAPGDTSQSPQPSTSDAPHSITPFLSISSGGPTAPPAFSNRPTFAPMQQEPIGVPSVPTTFPMKNGHPSTLPSGMYEPTSSSPSAVPSSASSLLPSIAPRGDPTGRPSLTVPSLGSASIIPSDPPVMTPTFYQSIRPFVAVFPSFSGLPSRETKFPTQGDSYSLLPTSLSSSTTRVPSRTVPAPQPSLSGGTTLSPTQAEAAETTTPSRVLSTQDSPSSLPNACSVRYVEWIGDGWCDSSNGLGVDEGYNSAECSFDGGDCCDMTCVSSDLHQCGTVAFHCIDPSGSAVFRKA